MYLVPIYLENAFTSTPAVSANQNSQAFVLSLKCQSSCSNGYLKPTIKGIYSRIKINYTQITFDVKNLFRITHTQLKKPHFLSQQYFVGCFFACRQKC